MVSVHHGSNYGSGPSESKAGNQAIDLSLKPRFSQSSQKEPHITLLKPEPRPAWSILWYQSLWPRVPTQPSPQHELNPTILTSFGNNEILQNTKTGDEDVEHGTEAGREENSANNSQNGVDLSLHSGRRNENMENPRVSGIKTCPLPSITDVATCDGPVHFQRISNPNFAITVEHREGGYSGLNLQNSSPAPSSKTYLCIYCNQSFKSLFCYQKHKKRHLNPVSVDITANDNLELTHSLSENAMRTADLNVQFFPCKKCGSKFPSYYFVHKHKKACEMTREEEVAHVDVGN